LRDSTIPKGKKGKNQYKERENSPLKLPHTPDAAPYTVPATTEQPTPTKVALKGALFVRDKLGLPATNNKIFETFHIFRSTAYKVLKGTIHRRAHVEEEEEKRGRAKLIPDEKVDEMVSLF
jgi:hypothetical protein